MRQLRQKVLYRTARSYVVVSEKLECGHLIDVLPNDELTAKYRHCNFCAEALLRAKAPRSARPALKYTYPTRTA